MQYDYRLCLLILFIFNNKDWFSFKVGFICYGAWFYFGVSSGGSDFDMWIGVCGGIYVYVDGLGTNLGICIDL